MYELIFKIAVCTRKPTTTTLLRHTMNGFCLHHRAQPEHPEFSMKNTSRHECTSMFPAAINTWQTPPAPLRKYLVWRVMQVWGGELRDATRPSLYRKKIAGKSPAKTRIPDEVDRGFLRDLSRSVSLSFSSPPGERVRIEESGCRPPGWKHVSTHVLFYGRKRTTAVVCGTYSIYRGMILLENCL